MDLRRLSPPISRSRILGVVTVEEVKAQARVRHETEDDLIESYIEAAFTALHGPEGTLNGYCLLEEQFELNVPSLASTWEMPLRPLSNASDAFVLSYRGDADVYTTIPSADYALLRSGDYSTLQRIAETPWLGYSSIYHPRAYRVTVRAGHATADTIPVPLKMAIKLLAATWFQNREALGPAGRTAPMAVPFGIQFLCGRYRKALNHS